MTTHAQAYLHGKPVCIGDRVYDCTDGWGCVESISCNCIWVKVGKRTRRKYNYQGYTGRRTRPTLYFHPPPAICLSKDPVVAQHQRELLEQTIALLNKICPEDKVLMHPCEYGAPTCNSCGQPSTTCGGCAPHPDPEDDPNDCPSDCPQEEMV